MIMERKMYWKIYKEAITSHIQKVVARFRRLRLGRRPAGVNEWPGNDSEHVQPIHDALLNYYKI